MDFSPEKLAALMPHETDLPEISQIFLSATAQDCKDYREAVRDFVHDNLKTAKIFLQENWAEGGKFVVDVCKERVHASDAYFGLFGHRYGWVPPGHQHSITDLEFRWAAERWGGPVPPIFILRPEPGSEADTYLKERAAFYHAGQPLADAEEDRAAQQRFLAAVNNWASEGRIQVFYRDPMQLVGKALSCVQNWNLAVLRQALHSRHKAAGEIPAEELGRIGREVQITALEAALDAFCERKAERAAAFLIHGPENHGQREFVEFLRHWDDKWEGIEVGMEVYCGQPAEPDSAESIICWICGQLGAPLLGEPSIDALADALTARLARHSVVIALRTAGRESARLALFHQRLWQPLCDALADRPLAGKRRLYFFLADHAVLPVALNPAFRTTGLDADDVDYHQVLALPPLTPVSAPQVRTWLKKLKATAGISLNEERREAISNYAASPDGHPPNVYNRLILEGFWSSAS